jgi:hypothetical protein
MNVKYIFEIRPTNEEQNDFIITVGKHLATEQHFKTRAEAIEYRETPKWDMVLAMVSEMFRIHEDMKHTTKKIEKGAKEVANAMNEDTKKQ